MGLWQEVVRTVYLGTQRQEQETTLGADADSVALNTLLAQLSALGDTSNNGNAAISDNSLNNASIPTSVRVDREGILLGAAAILSLHRRAGAKLPTNYEFMPDGARPLETRPCAPAKAIRALKEMLRGRFKDLLPEWLRLLDQAGMRLPEETLPLLFEQYKAVSNFHPLLAATAGERGRWLAAQNPEWEYILAVPTLDNPQKAAEISEGQRATWSSGSRPARNAVFNRFRQTAPDTARKLIEASWESEPWEDRVNFIQAFKLGLSAADENFLEVALRDRDERVRGAAAQLLAQLPGSDLSGRIWARAEGMLTVEAAQAVPFPRQAFSRPARPISRLRVNPPEKYDESLARDGIFCKRQRQFFGHEVGDKAYWARQIIGMIPPQRWCEHFSMGPDELIQLAMNGEWKATILGGWELAVTLFGNATWAAALLRAGGGKPESPFSTSPVKGFMAVMTSEQREAFITAHLKQHLEPLAVNHFGCLMLEACNHAWSYTFSRLVIEGLLETASNFAGGAQSFWLRRRALGGQNDPMRAIWNNLEQFGQWIDPSLADEFQVMVEAREDIVTNWQRPLELFVEMMKVRRDMREMFAPAAV